MLEARKVKAPLVHDDWNDNVFVTFMADTGIDAVAAAAAIRVTREIRTSRQCMLPLEGRGVVAWWDERLRYLTVITATQMPHIVQTGLAECLALSDGAARVISPDVGGGFGYKGLLCREEVVLGWFALHAGHPLRWLEDCREQLTANANCREHHYMITAYADAEGRLLGIDCEASVDAGAYSVYPTSAALEDPQPVAGSIRFLCLSLQRCGGRDQQVPDPALSRRRQIGRVPCDRTGQGCHRPAGRHLIQVACAAPSPPSTSKVCACVKSAASRTGASGSGSRSSASKAPTEPACWQAGDGRSCRATNLPSHG